MKGKLVSVASAIGTLMLVAAPSASAGTVNRYDYNCSWQTVVQSSPGKASTYQACFDKGSAVRLSWRPTPSGARIYSNYLWNTQYAAVSLNGTAYSPISDHVLTSESGAWLKQVQQF